MKLKIFLADTNDEVYDAWQEECRGLPGVDFHYGSIFQLKCDAIVSPANSFGYMDGGLDRTISNTFGWHVQERLQEIIRNKHHGELLVGQAEIVPTDHPKTKYVISAPTMRVPMIIRDTVNVYLATRAVMLLVKHGQLPDGTPISDAIHSIAIPGMGTGVGRVPPAICARQMRAAIESVLIGSSHFPESWSDAQRQHQALYTNHVRDIQFET